MSGKKKSVTLDYSGQFFYDQMVKTQSAIHREISLATGPEESMIQQKNKNVEDSYYSLEKQLKRHYLRIAFFYYNQKFAANQPFMVPNLIKSTDGEGIFPSELTGKILYKLINSFDDSIESQKKLNFLSLSTIPSLFIFFLQKKYVNKFIELIVNIESDERKIIFARSIFFSPFFVNFTNIALYQIFLPFCSKSKDLMLLDVEKLRGQIKTSIESNIQYLPSSIQLFLNHQMINNKEEYVKKCFFDPLCENPELFMIFDSWQTVAHPHTAFIKSKMKEIFADDEFTREITKLFTTIELDKISFFNEALTNNDNVLYYRFLDDYDKESINTERPMNLERLTKENYTIFKSGDPSENKPSSNMKVYQESMILSTSSFKELLRPLIKWADPLPDGIVVEEYEVFNLSDIITLIEKYVVNPCYSPFVSAKVYLYFDKLKEPFLKPNNINTQIPRDKESLVKMFSEMVNEHDEMKKEIERANKFSTEFTRLKECCINPMDSAQQLIHICCLKNNVKTIAETSCIYKIVSDPKSFNDDFEQKYKKFCEETIVFDQDIIIPFYHLFCRNLYYLDFLGQRPDLIELDKTMNFFLRRFYPQFVRNIKSNDKKENHKMKPVDKVLKNMIYLNESARHLREAFLENADPLTKILKINDCIIEGLVLLAREFGGYEEDDKMPFILILISYAAPQNFISTFIYIYEYILYSDTSSLYNCSKIKTAFDYVRIRLKGLIDKIAFGMFWDELVGEERNKNDGRLENLKDPYGISGFLSELQRILSRSKVHNVPITIQFWQNKNSENLCRQVEKTFKENVWPTVFINNNNADSSSFPMYGFDSKKFFEWFYNVKTLSTNQLQEKTPSMVFYAHETEELIFREDRILKYKNTKKFIVLADHLKNKGQIMEKIRENCRKNYNDCILVFANDVKSIVLKTIDSA